MKKLALLTYLIAVAIISSISNAQDVGPIYSVNIAIQDAVILPFFKALKNGDVNVISQCLSKDMYNEYRKLLEENKEYPKFLRSYYRGAEFRMANVSEVDGEVEVDIIIEFPNGSQSVNTLRINEEPGTDEAVLRKRRWRISGKPFNGGKVRTDIAFTTE